MRRIFRRPAQREWHRVVRRGWDRKLHGWNDPDELWRSYEQGYVDNRYVMGILAKGL